MLSRAYPALISELCVRANPTASAWMRFVETFSYVDAALLFLQPIPRYHGRRGSYYRAPLENSARFRTS